MVEYGKYSNELFELQVTLLSFLLGIPRQRLVILERKINNEHLSLFINQLSDSAVDSDPEPPGFGYVYGICTGSGSDLFDERFVHIVFTKIFQTGLIRLTLIFPEKSYNSFLSLTAVQLSIDTWEMSG
jgi:hypothetical protein